MADGSSSLINAAITVVVFPRLSLAALSQCRRTCRIFRAAVAEAIQTRCADLSLGTEPTPITAINSTADGVLYPDVPYVSRCVGASARTRDRLAYAAKLAGCSGNTCADACECCAIAGGGVPSYDHDGRLLSLLDAQLALAPVIECSEQCGCSSDCINRVVGRGVRAQLVVFRTADKGWGVKAGSFLRKGSFVCEYAGELLTAAEAAARRREDEMATATTATTATRATSNDDDSLHHNYVMSVLEHSSGNSSSGSGRPPLRTIIDPSRVGNVGRYLNHSCNPNLAIALVRVGSFVPSVAFFCARDIHEHEELSFHYGEGRVDDETTTGEDDDRARGGLSCATPKAAAPSSSLSRRKCRCAAPNCGGFLPSDLSADV